MKKILVVAFLMLSFGLKAQTSIGGGVTFGNGSTNISRGFTAITVKGDFGITDQISISPSFDYVMTGLPGVSFFGFNADGHYNLGDMDAFNYYPFAGLGLYMGNVKIPNYGNFSGSVLLINLGGGTTYAVSDGIKLLGELKYAISGNAYYGGGIAITLGVLFNL